jgi:hypothetical protein
MTVVTPKASVAVSEMRPVYFVGHPPGLYPGYPSPSPLGFWVEVDSFHWLTDLLRSKFISPLDFAAESSQQRS